MLQISNVVFSSINGSTLELSPMDDVTPLESVRIASLLTFTSDAGASSCLYDVQAYINQHNLQRHFKEVA
jgi:hypothetical protein